MKAAIKEWRHWLEGAVHPFQVITDHKNLEYIKSAKRLNPRQTHWSLFFTRFQFTVPYSAGVVLNSDPHQITTPLVLVGLGLGVGEGLRLGVGLGLGNQVAISTRGGNNLAGVKNGHNTGSKNCKADALSRRYDLPTKKSCSRIHTFSFCQHRSSLLGYHGGVTTRTTSWTTAC